LMLSRFRSWLRSFSAPRRRLTRKSPRLWVEPLETRTLLSGGPVFVTGTDAGSPGIVHIYDASTDQERFSIDPYGSAFGGGVRVAVGDVTGNGVPDVVT